LVYGYIFFVVWLRDILSLFAPTLVPSAQPSRLLSVVTSRHLKMDAGRSRALGRYPFFNLLRVSHSLSPPILLCSQPPKVFLISLSHSIKTNFSCLARSRFPFFPRYHPPFTLLSCRHRPQLRLSIGVSVSFSILTLGLANPTFHFFPPHKTIVFKCLSLVFLSFALPRFSSCRGVGSQISSLSPPQGPFIRLLATRKSRSPK